MTDDRKNRGFSLIELIIAVSILLILSGVLFMNIGVARKKEGARYSRELCNQIRLMRTVSMSKAGRLRLALYERDGNYYCVQEKYQSGGGTGGEWETYSEEVPMGSAGPVTYKNSAALSGDGSGVSGGTLVGEWRFHKDTGACTIGAGSVEIETAGKKRIVTTYEMSGYCEETAG